jgi:RNA polymerase sigma-70 factor (ECF subfamily)|tara:strand:- start:34 stop:507 length:474 start_codon:yes stop_codon:yes gene_type:complete
LGSEEFKSLYDKYFDSIRRYIYYRSGDKELSNDLAQDTFMQIWKKKFKITDEGLKNLIYKIANQMFLNFIKQKKNNENLLKNINFNVEYNDDQISEERRNKFNLALSNLNEKQRSVLLMKKIDGYTNKEIAVYLNISIKAVEKRMTQAIKNLKNQIK